MPTTVLVADDKEVVLSSSRLLLDIEPGIRIVGEGGSFQQTSQNALDLRPQVVVMDLHMPDESSATERL
jgi:DNA-binding NarL/FixJ family response regulator